MRIEIKKIGINSEGIGYFKRKPVFIDQALVNEVVDVEIIEEYESYLVGKVKKIIKKSSHRVEPKCRYYSYCGGCQIMHADYLHQLEIKKDVLNQTLVKYAKIDDRLLVDKVQGSKHIYNYRNELKLPIKSFDGKLYAGMYLKNSNSFKRINVCLIHDKNLEKVKNKILDSLNILKVKSYNKENKNGIRYLILRIVDNKFQCHLIFGKEFDVSKLSKKLQKIKELSSFFVSFNDKKDPLINKTNLIHIFGDEKLDLKINNYHFKVSMETFLQLNLSQAINIFNYISSLIKDKTKLIVEEYCGIGIISTLINKKADKIYAAEINKKSIEDFKKIIELNDIKNIYPQAVDSVEHLRNIKEKIDYLIVDPPRSGLGNKMIKEILNKDIKNIIYMSCGQSSLAKDLDLLKSNYKIENIRAYDMFSQTSHVETVCLMTRS